MFQIHQCSTKPIFHRVNISANTYEHYSSIVDSASNNTGSGFNVPKVNYLTNTFQMNLERNAFGLYLVKVSIHQKTYRFILDTGAQISGISSKHIHLIEQYKTTTTQHVKSASGQIKGLGTVCLDSYYLGAIHIENHSMVVMDENDFKIRVLHHRLDDFDGILGWDVLRYLDFEINTKNNTFIALRQIPQEVNKNLIFSLLPIVVVEDNEKQVLFGIDTGAAVSWLNANYAKSNNYAMSGLKRMRQVGVFGVEHSKSRLVIQCDYLLYKHKIKLKYVRLGHTSVLHNFELSGMFGNEIFEDKRIQFLGYKGVVRILD